MGGSKFENCYSIIELSKFHILCKQKHVMNDL